MRYRRAALACSAAALAGSVALWQPASGAINPASPGLAPAEAYGEKAIRNNGASALCVECHTENPKSGFGTHFVLNRLVGELRKTHSGGGWDKGAWGVREQAEFFKLSPWKEGLEENGSGGSSRYGDVEKWESVVFSGGSDPLLGLEAARHERSGSAMGELEMICESCHSLRTSVEGRYTLLAKVTSSDTVDDKVEGATAPLCVGCHGFLYQDVAHDANSMNSLWSDPRNVNLVTGQRRGNNEVHYISGKPYPRNHHVTTGAAIDVPLAAAGLLVRDVAVLSREMVNVPIRTDYRKGTMPIRQVPLPPIVFPSDAKNLHCVTCHAPGHGGNRTMGAAILRGEDLGGKDVGFGIDRITDGKEWGSFRDGRFCGLCHE